MLTANTFIHRKERGGLHRDDPSQWASRLGDLSHPLSAALGMWERSMWPLGLSVAKVPHCSALVLKLDPVKEQKKQENKPFPTQCTLFYFKSLILAHVRNEHACWPFYKHIKSVVFTAALHSKREIFIYHLIFLLLYLHTVDNHYKFS